MGSKEMPDNGTSVLLREAKRKESCKLVESKEMKPGKLLTANNEEAFNSDPKDPNGPIMAKLGKI